MIIPINKVFYPGLIAKVTAAKSVVWLNKKTAAII